MEPLKIFFDLDDVLADFDKGVRELAGFHFADRTHRTKEEDDMMWEAVRRVDHFYLKLDLMPGTKEFFDRVWNRYDGRVEILSGIPKPHRHIQWATEDKIFWSHAWLHPDVKVNIVFKEGKVDYCFGPEYVLIDDLELNIRRWRQKGGTGIHFTDIESAEKQLYAL